MTWDILALAEEYNTLWRRWEEALQPQEWVWGKTQELAGKGVQLALRGCPRARAGTWRSFESSLLRTWSLP